MVISVVVIMFDQNTFKHFPQVFGLESLEFLQIMSLEGNK